MRQHTGYGCRKRNREIPERNFLWDLCMTLDMEFKKTTLKPSSGTDLPPKRDIPRQIQVYMLGRKGCSGII